MGQIQLFKIDDGFHPWENEITNLLNSSGSLDQSIHESKYDYYFVDVNAVTNFYIKGCIDLGEKIREKVNNGLNEVIFIISFIGEGIHHKMIHNFIEDLLLIGFNKNNVRLFYSSYYDVPHRFIHSNFWEYFVKIPVIDHDMENDFLSTLPSKYFLCLVRQTNPSRSKFFSKFRSVEWFNNKEIMDLSYGVSEKNNKFKPIVFDNPRVSDKQQHITIDPKLLNQLFNLVVETHITIKIESNGVGYITEKSMKPFYYCQIPIWVAQPNVVNIIRELGFDVYDDILDNHNYDLIEDDDKRYENVINLLNTLKSRYTLEGIIDLKKNLKDRVLKNRERLFELDSQHPSIFSEKFKLIL